MHYSKLKQQGEEADVRLASCSGIKVDVGEVVTANWNKRVGRHRPKYSATGHVFAKWASNTLCYAVAGKLFLHLWWF